MNRIQIINMFRTLGRVKLNKITDKELRNALIYDHLNMFRMVKENDDYILALRQQFDPDAIKELNEAYETYANEEVTISLKKVNREAFADVIASSDIEFTLSDLIILEPLFESE